MPLPQDATGFRERLPVSSRADTGYVKPLKVRDPRMRTAWLSMACPMLCLTLFGLAFAPPRALAAEEAPVTIDMQDKVEEAAAKQLVKPETALWTFDFVRPYPGGGQIVCGKISYQDSTKKYRGPYRFFATVRSDKVVKVTLQEASRANGQSLDFDFAALCDRK